MIKIKDIKFGLIPTGPAMGVSSLQIFFSEDDSKYELDEYDNGKKWEYFKESRQVREVRKELFSDFLKKIDEKNLKKQFSIATNSSQGCFITYMGGIIDKPENFIEFNRFNIDLSNKTWNDQISYGLKMDRMKPPYSIFVGIPKFLSGKNQFYQLFNNSYPIIYLKNEEKPTFNALSLQECFNGPFSLATIFFENGDFSQIKNIVKKFNIPGFKVVLIDIKSSKENSLEQFVQDNYFRYFPYLKGKNFLKLI
jgi:hypothetical protein